VPDNIGMLFVCQLVMCGPREMLLSSEKPVVRQFLNARRVGPIGMSEEKDLSELEAESRLGSDPGKLPPIPPQLLPSSGQLRRSQHAPGEWLRRNGVQPPPGSFIDEVGRNWLEEWPRYVASMSPVPVGPAMPGGYGPPPPGAHR